MGVGGRAILRIVGDGEVAPCQRAKPYFMAALALANELATGLAKKAKQFTIELANH
jgi:hypothetical protein